MNQMRFWLIGSVFLIIEGCAINDKGLITLRYFENASSYLVAQESWGGYLSTRQTDGGLTLGYETRIRVFPKRKNEITATHDEMLRQITKLSEFKEIQQKDADIMDLQPYAWIEKNRGIMVHANVLKIGILAGTESLSAIRLPSNFDGIFIFNYQNDDSIQVVIDETPQSEQ